MHPIAQDDSNEVLKRILKCKWWLITQACWDGQTLAFQGLAGPASPIPCPYNFYFIKSPWKLGTIAPEAHRPRSFQIRIQGPNRWPTPTKLGVPSNFCVIKCPPKCIAEAPEPHWGAPGPWGQFRGPQTRPNSYALPSNVCFSKILPNRTVEAPEAPRTPIMHHVPGWGYRVKKTRTFPPLRTTSVPNFI